MLLALAAGAGADPPGEVVPGRGESEPSGGLPAPGPPAVAMVAGHPSPMPITTSESLGAARARGRAMRPRSLCSFARTAPVRRGVAPAERAGPGAAGGWGGRACGGASAPGSSSCAAPAAADTPARRPVPASVRPGRQPWGGNAAKPCKVRATAAARSKNAIEACAGASGRGGGAQSARAGEAQRARARTACCKIDRGCIQGSPQIVSSIGTT